MISTQDIRYKEVINIYDGKSMGFVEDIEIDLTKGTIEGIIVPAQRRMFQFFGKEEDIVIRWKDIKRIGDDVILVEVASGKNLHMLPDMVYNSDSEESIEKTAMGIDKR